MGWIIGQLTVGGGQQMRLADAETTVQIQPDTRRGFSSAEKSPAAATVFDSPLAKPLGRRDGGRLSRLGRVWSERFDKLEAHLRDIQGAGDE